jgi:hypothetical protein
VPEDQNLEVEAVEVPSWVPEKFKSNPEKFAEAYTNLEREFHASNQRTKAIEQNYTDLTAEIEELRSNQQPQQQYDSSEIAAQYGLEPEQLQLMAQLAQQAADIKYQEHQKQSQPLQQSQENLIAMYATNEVSGRNPDFAVYSDEIRDLFTSRPWMYPEGAKTSPQQAVEAIETAYNLVKYQNLNSQAAQENVTAEQLMERMKLQAQTAQGADGRPAPQDPNANRWEEIQNAPTRSYSDIAREIAGR